MGMCSSQQMRRWPELLRESKVRLLYLHRYHQLSSRTLGSNGEGMGSWPRAVQELTLVGSIAYVDSLALFKQLPAKLTLISISTEFVLRCAHFAVGCVPATVHAQQWPPLSTQRAG